MHCVCSGVLLPTAQKQTKNNIYIDIYIYLMWESIPVSLIGHRYRYGRAASSRGAGHNAGRDPTHAAVLTTLYLQRVGELIVPTPSLSPAFLALVAAFLRSCCSCCPPRLLLSVSFVFSTARSSYWFRANVLHSPWTVCPATSSTTSTHIICYLPPLGLV